MDDRSPLEIWQERLDYFRKALAIAADPAQKFQLEEQIKECQQKIKELAPVISQERSLNNGQAISHDLGEIATNTAWYTFKEYGKTLGAIALDT